ncbi:hypothetical protein M9434_004261 [Picochlorum sp. BPE23]|nr:hypothetical protein M9434_004261 [Picochlorum sp. BPE23]
MHVAAHCGTRVRLDLNHIVATGSFFRPVRYRSSLEVYGVARNRRNGSCGRLVWRQLGALAPVCAAGLQDTRDDKEYCVVNFYHLVDIVDPDEVISRHKEYLEDKEVKGRIYISEQGINAQFGGVTEDAVGYAEWLIANEPNFDTLEYSVDPVETHMFPKLRLQYKANLISLSGGMQAVPVTNPEARATKVKPSDWKKMLQQGVEGRTPVVLDVRNSYEWDAGHFEGAERPLEDNFHETPTEATEDPLPKYLDGLEPETPVMMYCTGGIRCDVYSTYLKQKGFQNLYTLEGGIQNYMKNEGLDHWKGSLYVFDGRMAIRPNKDAQEPLEPVASCALCGGKAILPHLNCANVDCNKLFLACQECQDKLQGCCCEQCTKAPRLCISTSDIDTLGKKLDEMELQHPDAFESDTWPHGLHLMAHIAARDLPNARFMSKRIPDTIASRDAAVKKAHAVLRLLWNKEYVLVWEELEFDWPEEYKDVVDYLAEDIKKHVLQMIGRVYSRISLATVAKLINCSDEDAIELASRECNAVKEGDFLVMSGVSAEREKLSETDVQMLQSILVHIS